MTKRVYTTAFFGPLTVVVSVQVHFASGIPSFNIVGLPSKTISESKYRIRSALDSIGIKMPIKRITVNLYPSDLLKQGSHYDLAIAASILTEIGLLPELKNYFVIGELSLDGEIMQTCGTIPSAIEAKKSGMGIICSPASSQEAKMVNCDVLPFSNILNMIEYFKSGVGKSVISKNLVISKEAYPDMQDIIGQKIAKRAMEIAAAGSHNILIIGPPGSGKTMLAKRFMSILPDLTEDEIVEINLVRSFFSRGIWVTSRPFREPHHSITLKAMVGGGNNAEKIGEVTLAHNGVLFLDELPEFSSSAIDSLRQILENREVSVSRVNAKYTYPANFILVSAMNPCKCGFLGAKKNFCNRTDRCGIEYTKRVSAPFMDRIDMVIRIDNEEKIRFSHKNSIDENYGSQSMKSRVVEARDAQTFRYGELGFNTNSRIPDSMVYKSIEASTKAVDLLNQFSNLQNISYRRYMRVLKVARTIADLERSEETKKMHVEEAIFYSGRTVV